MPPCAVRWVHLHSPCGQYNGSPRTAALSETLLRALRGDFAQCCHLEAVLFALSRAFAPRCDHAAALVFVPGVILEIEVAALEPVGALRARRRRHRPTGRRRCTRG